MRIEGTKEYIKKLKGIADDLSGKAGKDPLREAVGQAAGMIEAEAKKNLTGGHPLHVRTGRLRSSVHFKTARRGSKVTAQVGTDVVYGAVHEFGAKIVPSHAKFLKFQVKPGEWRTAKSVTIPARPWLSPAVKAAAPRVKRHIHEAVRKILRKRR